MYGSITPIPNSKNSFIRSNFHIISNPTKTIIIVFPFSIESNISPVVLIGFSCNNFNLCTIASVFMFYFRNEVSLIVFKIAKRFLGRFKKRRYI